MLNLLVLVPLISPLVVSYVRIQTAPETICAATEASENDDHNSIQGNWPTLRIYLVSEFADSDWPSKGKP
jgi:hypothetical protein